MTVRRPHIDLNLARDAGHAAADSLATDCIHVARCRCRDKWRTRGFVIVAELLDLGWTVTPPEEKTDA